MVIILNYDENQLEAIKYLDNALVVAGAGSGKTSTIIGKVNYLIENNIYKKEEILIISFTNETVNSLKNKIKYDVDVKTFHKLALDIINVNEKISISSNYYLDFIIDEYLKSYALYNRKTNNLYKRIINNQNEISLKTLINTFINVYKCNYPNINFLFNLYQNSIFINKIYYRIILDIYHIYQRELESTNTLDLNDIIIKGTELIKKNICKVKYKYIIIDEFQDSSLIRLDLVISILKQNNGKIFVVGDDYQSIYRFSGCDLSLFLNFTNYVPEAKVLYLNNNYRNSQELIDISNDFILKNKRQVKKNSICHKKIIKPIKIVFYVDKSQIINIILKEIIGNVLILGRNNRDKDRFNVIENEYIKYLTIHRAKGLEEDNVILINLEDSYLGFPSKITNEKILCKILKSDYIIYEEERRLFYVALTRAKNYIYLLTPINNPSIFIKELIRDYKKDLEIIHIN